MMHKRFGNSQRESRNYASGKKDAIPTKRHRRKDVNKKDALADVPGPLRKSVQATNKSEERVQKSESSTYWTKLLKTESTGGLEPETDLDRTLHMRQAQILPHVDLATSAKSAFRLDLSSSNLSPYTHCTYSRSGRSLLISSRRGHVAMSNWRHLTLQTELHLNETIRSSTFLHNDAFFATAQKSHAFIYDSSGAQVHALRHHKNPHFILSLPYHLLLATVSAASSNMSRIVYTDTSTGGIIAHHDFSNPALTLSGSTSACVNPSNGVLHVAHQSGAVSLWSPNCPRPLARVFSHDGGVRHVGVMSSGSGMISVGSDGVVKHTDLRTFNALASWRMPAVPTAMAISQRQLIGLAFGATVQVWALRGSGIASIAKLGHNQPYMSETFSGKRITGLDFCPFEDLLAVCHQDGMFSMLVPGAGEAVFDTTAPNPYETKKQRRENEVRGLLDKLPPETITLDPSFIGSVDPEPEERLNEIREREKQANIQQLSKDRFRNKMRGRSKISKVVRRKENNRIAIKELEMRDGLADANLTHQRAAEIHAEDEKAVVAGTASGHVDNRGVPDALARFRLKKY